MEAEQKMIGAGAFQILNTTKTYDTTLPTNNLPQIYQMAILEAGTITTLEDADGNDLLPLLDDYQAGTGITKVPIPFKEGQYAAKVVTDTAVLMLYKLL